MLNYRLEGQGPPLLMIHGYGASFSMWQNLTPLLKPHFTLVMIELPGINNSPPPQSNQPYYNTCSEEITALREALGYQYWSVLSYSAGTRACEAYLHHDTDHVEKAIFLCPALPSIVGIWAMKFLIFLDRWWPAFTTFMLSGWRLSFLIGLLAFNGRWLPITRTITQEIKTQPMSILKATLREMPGAGGTPFSLPEIPVQFVWGRWDLLGSPIGHARPGDRIITANHAAPLLAAAKVCEVVLAFIA
jgi:pimeloyl-ACP methyl ester carboxylesterase